MKIICDIGHPAHVNFLKNAVRKLSEMGNEIVITCLTRGKLPSIIEKEFSNHHITYIGRHGGTKLSIIFDANVKKFFNLLLFVLHKKVDVGMSVGSFTLGLVLKILGKPNLQFDDDPERKVNVFLEKLTSTELFFPPIINPKGKIKIINALKEWAYLSPKYFVPKNKELVKYNLRPCNYIFVREVATKSLNYKTQLPNIISTFAGKLPNTYKVLLSLEDKTTINKYPSEWILLEEPLNDIHSLMYYSKIVISSGDSMAREGALLGVPSIYCGLRNMRAIKMLTDRGTLFKVKPCEVPDFVTEIISGQIRIEEQILFRKKLLSEWDDVTELIIKKIKKYEKQIL